MTAPAPNTARERHLHDPWAPRRPEFPRARLRRSGLSAEAMDHLQDRYDDMSEEQAIRWTQALRAQSGAFIRERFTMPEGTAEEIRAALEDLDNRRLRDLAAAEGMHLSGTNEDLRDRLAGTETPVTPVNPVPAAPVEPAPAPQPAAPEPAEEPADAVVGEPTSEEVTPENTAEVTTADGETVTEEIPATAAVTGTVEPPATAEQPAPAPAPTTARRATPRSSRG